LDTAVSSIRQVPAYDSDDKGKVLKVNSLGNLTWGNDNNTTYTASDFASSFATKSHKHAGTDITSAVANATNATKVYVDAGSKDWILTCASGKGDSSVYGAAVSSVAAAASESSRRYKNTITTIND
jgi:hypothetical protein